jgi:predicted outer membrane repeat protein
LNIKISIIYVMSLFLTGLAVKSEVIYVNANAPAGGDGSSWTTAHEFLQDALDQTISGQGDQVWIAQGAYFPDDGSNVTQGDRLASFVIKDQVELYGGFGGFEGSLQERDSISYKTVLSGEIYPDPIYWTVHVTSVENNATFDGLSIIRGTANGYGADEDQSAAIYGGGSITATNCTFSDNSADLRGGVAFMGNWTATNCTFTNNSADYGGVASYGTWSVTNCSFSGNYAEFGGVARSGNWTANNCTFSGNSATKQGGVLSSAGTSGWVVINCVFFGNSAVERGGVANESDLTATNCIFSNNTSDDLGGVAYYGDWTVSSCTFSDNMSDSNGGVVAYRGNWAIVNSVVSGNGGTRDYFHDMHSIRNTLDTALTPLTVRSYNIMEGGPNWLHGTTDYLWLITGTSDLGDGSYIIRDLPLFVDASDPDGPDDIWGTEDDGLRLQENSPAVSMGDMGFLAVDVDDLDFDSDILELMPIDLAGYDRVQESQMDLGAYEYGNAINRGPDTDLDGIFDNIDLDDDNDGLTDVEELALGLNPILRDSNANGVDDLRETYIDFTSNPAKYDLYTVDEIADLRPGSVMLEVTAESTTLSMKVEESIDLIDWTDTEETADATLPAPSGKKFFRIRFED